MMITQNVITSYDIFIQYPFVFILLLIHQLITDTLAASGQTVFDTRLGCLSDNMNPLYQHLIDANKASLSTSTRLKFSLPIHRYINTPTVKKFNLAENTFFG